MCDGLVCTTRFDPVLVSFRWNDAPDGSASPYLLLAFQLDRLRSSARVCRWTIPESLDYAALERVCDEAVRAVDGTTPLKIRVVLSPSGIVTASASPVEPWRCDPTAASRFIPGQDASSFSPTLSICIDTQPTSGTTSLKTTNRRPYDDARARAGILPPSANTSRDTRRPDDVLLFNSSGLVMESSIRNVAFYRHGRWITPPLTLGCISGVFRRWLLENGRIHEADQHSLSIDSIEDNEWVLVFNGVSGCQLGRVYRETDRNIQTP